ncbi:MAG: TonB-dependent receptor [Acidobacteria bacterium]|nr:TonB-dependent receptor [Acidobacteriota bacterium]
MRLLILDASGAGLEVVGYVSGAALKRDLSFSTDPSGRAVVSPLPAGRYRVTAAKRGFASRTIEVEVTAAKPTEQTIRLDIAASSFEVSVVDTTPLPGVDQDPFAIAAPVQLATAKDVRSSGALTLTDLLNQRLNGVFLNEIQGNPFQADLSYRGYTASPLLGTPQGLSVYMDGVRMNQPFGDVLSWDLIPRNVIEDTVLMPGSNPLFGLNTLGGAVSIHTKDGRSAPGTVLQLGGGSFARKSADIEHGGSTARGLNWYLASSLFFEDGWRDDSPSNVRQFFGKFGKQAQRTSAFLTLAYANNSLLGNGLQEQRFVQREYSSVYTKPDINTHRSPSANLGWRHAVSNRLNLFGNAYYRYLRTRAFNGDINEGALDQSVYQPSAAEITALRAAGYSGFPLSGANATNTPFPYWRCIGQVLLRDEPGEKCNGLLNRGSAVQHNYGASGQVSWFTSGPVRSQLTAGAAWDRSHSGFEQSTQLGYLNADRSITGVNAFADGVTGGEVDGEPFDTRVYLRGHVQTGSVYATDTLSSGRWNVTLSGRYNHTTIDNKDRLLPIAGPGSLTGRHTFQRFNPAVGVTYGSSSRWNLYAGYSEGSRAPTSVELGCADPNTPCKLPNAMAGDPPLQQVVTRTVEAGVRGTFENGVRWSTGYFRAENRNDILFVASEQTGFGYFKNFGQTRRQGVELSSNGRWRRLTMGGGYTFLEATYQSPESVNGSGNSSNVSALAGRRGLESSIGITPGDQMPMTPSHMLKGFADLQATSKWTLNLGLFAMSSAFARGNENNRHQADGRFYLGQGSSPGYGVVNAGSRYQVTPRVQLYVQVNNLLDRRYYSAAQLGPVGFQDNGNFIARPFPAINGEFPVQQSTFFAPGAPRGVWGGLRFKF